MKVTKLILCLVILSLVVTVPMMAKGPTKKSGNSHMGHLYLYEKDPADWTIVEGGRWGKMNYTWQKETLDLVFNGHHFGDYYNSGTDDGTVDDPEDDDPNSFCLIYYPDPWPGDGLICLGEGVVERTAVMVLSDPEDPESELIFDHWSYDVHIKAKGINDIPDLPIPSDENDGAKIWLVKSDDLDCETGAWSAWNPEDYLFEEALIEYDDPTYPAP